MSSGYNMRKWYLYIQNGNHEWNLHTKGRLSELRKMEIVCKNAGYRTMIRAFPIKVKAK